MIDRNGNLLLIWRRRLLIWLRPLAKACPVGLRLVKQGDVIRGRGFEAVPHLPGLRCVREIWGGVGREESCDPVSRTLSGELARRRGVQGGRPGGSGGGSPAPRRRRGATHASPRGRGREGRPRAAPGSRREPEGGGGGETERFPHPAPREAAAATGLLGLIQVRRGGRGRRGCLSCCLSCCCPCRRWRRGLGPHPTPP